MMSLRLRIGRFCIRLALIYLAAAVLLNLPDPQTSDTLHLKNAVVALVSVIAIGKLLYDTFFYDRFPM